MREELSGYQTALAFHMTESSLRELLERGLGRPIKLVLTRNASSMLSAVQKTGVQHVRLHEMFLAAGPDIIEEIIVFIRKRRSGLPLFRRFVRDNSAVIRKKPPQKVSIKTAGRYYDLLDLYDEVNQEYFGGRIASAITWSVAGARVGARKRTLGSYSSNSDLIRINPVLDTRNVPRYFIKYVVYHEMLHAGITIQQKGSRRCVHSSEFRRREKMFRDYERAVEWERRTWH